MSDIESNKKTFIEIVKSTIHRNGIESLMQWLDTTDFFTAPSSARYHGAEPGGLVVHSLEVYKYLKLLQTNESDETIAIVALFHDLCKVHSYKQSMRNVKDDNGRWVQVPYYEYDYQFPMGHGEKSMYLLMKHIQLTDEEAMSIRWHMGGYFSSNPGETQCLSYALKMYNLVLKIQTADQQAAFWESK